MKNLLDQFRNLNPKDPGAWPPLPKALALLGLFVAIVVGAFFGHWQGQLEALDGGRTQEQSLKEDYVKKKRQAINLDLHRQQLREIDSSFGALLKQLPNKSQMDALFPDADGQAAEAAAAAATDSEAAPADAEDATTSTVDENV